LSESSWRKRIHRTLKFYLVLLFRFFLGLDPSEDEIWCELIGYKRHPTHL
jgi:hypothetical protein